MNVHILDCQWHEEAGSASGKVICFFEGRVCVFTSIPEIADRVVYDIVATDITPAGLPELVFYHLKTQPVRLYCFYLRLRKDEDGKEVLQTCHKTEVAFDPNVPLIKAIMSYLCHTKLALIIGRAVGSQSH